jgi:hypothetical protein
MSPKEYHLLNRYPAKSAFLAAAFVVLLALLLPSFAHAAITTPTTRTGASAKMDSPDQSIIISPFLSETKILAADPSKDVSVNLVNNTGRTQSFVITALDFGSLSESGGVVFAGNTNDKLIHKYGLATWLRLPKDHITLSSGQSTSVQATIVNEPTLGPGGHYAALIMTVVNAASAGTETVSVKQKISALIFATKVGGEVYDLRLTKIQQDGSWRQLPKIITLDFKNTGNVHVVPRGIVRLISPSGNVVSRGIINEASAYVLPETSRQLVIQTESVSNHGWEPGTYKLQVDYRYDGYDKFASKTIDLRYYNFIGIAFLCLVVFVLVVAGLKLRRHRSQSSIENT